jgi:hypothetical protein
MTMREIMNVDTLVASNINSAGMRICNCRHFIKTADLEEFLEALYVEFYFNIGCYEWILST